MEAKLEFRKNMWFCYRDEDKVPGLRIAWLKMKVGMVMWVIVYPYASTKKISAKK